jgi:hypothetical protein
VKLAFCKSLILALSNWIRCNHDCTMNKCSQSLEKTAHQGHLRESVQDEQTFQHSDWVHAIRINLRLYQMESEYRSIIAVSMKISTNRCFKWASWWKCPKSSFAIEGQKAICSLAQFFFIRNQPLPSVQFIGCIIIQRADREISTEGMDVFCVPMDVAGSSKAPDRFLRWARTASFQSLICFPSSTVISGQNPVIAIVLIRVVPLCCIEDGDFFIIAQWTGK